MITGSQKAYQYALSNAFRSGASRSGYVTARTFVSIDGIYFPPRTSALDPGILYDSITIQDTLNEKPNTASFTTWMSKPSLGATVSISLGSKAGVPMFAGTVMDVQQQYEQIPAHLRYHVSCIDWHWRLNKLVVAAKYTNLPAENIIADLLTTWAPGYTRNHLVVGLGMIDEITFTNERLGDCFSRIAARVGAYWYIDTQKDLHFFVADDPDIAQPRALTPTHPSLSNVSVENDLSQMISRVHVEGGGSNASIDCPVGARSIPVNVGSWYESNGGTVISGQQRISYTSVVGLGGAGSLVGPGVTPQTPITAKLSAGTGVDDGTHSYVYTWVTASGETLPSPLPVNGSATVTVATITNTSTGVTVINNTPSWSGSMVNGAAYQYKLTLSTIYPPAAGYQETLATFTPNPGILPIKGSLTFQIMPFTVPPGVVGVTVYRTAANGSVFKRLYNFSIPEGHSPWGYVNVDTSADSALGVNEPTTNTAILKRVQLSGISTGPVAVTSRHVYRTAANQSVLKRLWTLADNTTTTLEDGASDSSLGVGVPASDTSGLTMPSGQIQPGSTTVITAGAGWATAAGGYAVIGNGTQVIRYLGVSGNTLTGIPSAGPGAIVASIAYNSTITSAPSLEGLPAAGSPGAIRYDIRQGDPVNLWITVDDAAAIALLADFLGDDGIQTEYIQDRRLGATECYARARAHLARRGSPLVTLRYASRDLNTQAGSTIVADLPAPADIHVTLKAQQVTITNLSHLHYPRYSVLASTERYSLEDLLRDLRKVTS
jgi:hypothetical protein